MGDILSKIHDLLDDTKHNIESTATKLLGEPYEIQPYNQGLVEDVLTKKTVNFVLKSEKLGRCYHRYFAVGFNVKSDKDLNSGNFDNRRIIERTDEYVYYSYNIDSGD